MTDIVGPGWSCFVLDLCLYIQKHSTSSNSYTQTHSITRAKVHVSEVRWIEFDYVLIITGVSTIRHRAPFSGHWKASAGITSSSGVITREICMSLPLSWAWAFHRILALVPCSATMPSMHATTTLTQHNETITDVWLFLVWFPFTPVLSLFHAIAILRILQSFMERFSVLNIQMFAEHRSTSQADHE